MPSIIQSMKYNWRTLFNDPFGEIAGSLGDLGTLIPVITALTASGNISLTSTLLFSGISNIVSGAFFGIPLVVQPMSAIASISLSRGLKREETMAAGLGVATVVLLLSITGGLSRVSRTIPTPVIKGIQVGAGLSLCLNAGSLLSGLDYDSNQWDDNLLWTAGAFMLLYGTSRMPRFPVALVLFFVGIILALIKLISDEGKLPEFGMWWPFVPIIPLPEDFTKGFGAAGVGQIPLTILNSVIAVKYLSEDLLPSRPAPSITGLGISVGLMNLTGCWFGAMPVCHGSGGLAAQHRFGARSGASVIVLGLFKIALGLTFGNSLTELLQKFPKCILGVMVFAAGMELLSVAENLNISARDLITHAPSASITPSSTTAPSSTISSWRGLTERDKKERFLVMTVTAAAMIALQNALVGFAAGFLVWALIRLQDKVQDLRPSRIGSMMDENTPLLRN
ncbi:hypothetical protein DFP73DRAFT_489784 [Morchella snyderi]|nr:hypothetical protein DFP73DRAFT_489784 [Morchella snyderi]